MKIKKIIKNGSAGKRNMKLKNSVWLVSILFMVSSSLVAQTDGSNLKRDYDMKKRAWGYIDKSSGKKVIAYKYYGAQEFYAGLAVVNTKDNAGMINTRGETVVPFEYNTIELVKCTEPAYILKRIDKKQNRYMYGLADASGKITIPCTYYEIKAVGSIFKVWNYLNTEPQGLGFANCKGEFIAPPNMKNAPEPKFYWGFDRIAIEKDGQTKFGVITDKGSMLLPFEYKDMFTNPDLIVATDFNSKCHIFDKTGRKISDIAFDEIDTKGSYNTISNNEIRVKKDGKYGLFGKTGLIVPCEYDEIPDGFNDGFMTVKINNKSGVVNRQGKLLVPCEYEAAFYYYLTKLLYVYRDNKRGYYNLSGKMILPCEFSSIPDSLVSGCFIVKQDGKLGMVDTTGMQSVPFVLDQKFAESNPKKTIEYCTSILNINPVITDAVNLMALAYYTSATPDDALKELTAMSAKYLIPGTRSGMPAIYYYKALAYMKKGNLDEAYTACLNTTYPTTEGWSCPAFTALANERFKKGLYKEALNACNSAKTYTGVCAEAAQLESAIKSEMAAKGIKIESPTITLGKIEPKRDIYYIGDDRKKFPADWPESFYWNPSEQLNNKFSDGDCNCKISNFNLNYAGHNNNYFDLRCSKIISSKDILGKWQGYEVETNFACYIKSIERINGQYVFYAEQKDGPINYKDGIFIYYKSKNEISFKITLDNKLYEMKTALRY